MGLRGRDELVSLYRDQVARDAVFNLFYAALPASWLECMARKGTYTLFWWWLRDLRGSSIFVYYLAENICRCDVTITALVQQKNLNLELSDRFRNKSRQRQHLYLVSFICLLFSEQLIKFRMLSRN